MPDDEPLEDARAVATAAAAAAARVTETMARQVSDTKARERDWQAAQHSLGAVGLKVDQSYDSPERRGKRDAAREEAGVPLKSRRVVATADLMNGQDPILAATAGKAERTRARRAALAQEQMRGR